MESKVIGGKMYDTKTAEVIGSFANTHDKRDFQYCSETLYRKHTGEFFLYGEGGPLSLYCEEVGRNEWGYGSSIIPMSEAAAKEWAEEHLTGEKYVEVFGPVEE